MLRNILLEVILRRIILLLRESSNHFFVVRQIKYESTYQTIMSFPTIRRYVYYQMVAAVPYCVSVIYAVKLEAKDTCFAVLCLTRVAAGEIIACDGGYLAV